MTKPHFSLRTVFALVTLAAIGCAALANPNDLRVSVVFSGTVAILGLALVVAVMRRRGAIGLAICGWLYLGLLLWPGALDNIVPNLLTSKAIEAAWDQHPRSASLQTRQLGNGRILVQDSVSGKVWISGRWSSDPFQRIGHCLFALLFAALGGSVAGWLEGRKTKPKQPRESP